MKLREEINMIQSSSKLTMVEVISITSVALVLMFLCIALDGARLAAGLVAILAINQMLKSAGAGRKNSPCIFWISNLIGVVIYCYFLMWVVLVPRI